MYKIHKSNNNNGDSNHSKSNNQKTSFNPSQSEKNQSPYATPSVVAAPSSLTRGCQPQLPLTTVCCYCEMSGWGRPISPVAGKRVKHDTPSMLYECRSCFKIAHIQCTLQRCGVEGVDGRVLVELPNCWTCPACVQLGTDSCPVSPPADFSSAVKRRPGRPPGRPRKPLPQLPDGVPASQLLDTPAFQWRPPDTATRRTDGAVTASESEDMCTDGQRSQPQCSTSPDQNNDTSMEDVASGDRQRPVDVPSAVDASTHLRYDNTIMDVSSTPKSADNTVESPSLLAVSRSASLCGSDQQFAAMLDTIYNRHSHQLTHLQASSKRQLKRPLFVVRPAPDYTAAVSTAPQLNRAALVCVFRHLERDELLVCQQVCHAWCVAALDRRLWPLLAVDNGRPLTDRLLRFIVRRQPAQLRLSWSTVTRAQLSWLLTRLPRTRRLQLAGVSVTALAALRSAGCPSLHELNLCHVHGLTDSRLAFILSPPVDRPPGSSFSGSRLWRLRRLQLADAAITLESCQLLASTLPMLCQLDVSGCVLLTDGGLTHLSVLPRLRQLDLSGCKQLTTHGVNQLLSGCPTLQQVKVAHIPQISVTDASRLSVEYNVAVSYC